MTAPLLIKTNSDRTAAVNRALPWIPVKDYPPPKGVKLLLINRRFGVATLGVYLPNQNWTHWQGMPYFAEEINDDTL